MIGVREASAVSNSPDLIIVGVFVADASYRAERLPRIGETLAGESFALGPGGKGSNQAVAAARLGSKVAFISRTGTDAFADMAWSMWQREGIEPLVFKDAGSATGSAFIFVDAASANNAIIVVPGAAGEIEAADLDRHRASIESSRLFMTQLEVPCAVAAHGLRMARNAGVTTILNPAPAITLTDDMLADCDYLIPNETEASILTGCAVASLADAERAAGLLRGRGCGCVIITLGAGGALFDDGKEPTHIPATHCGEVIDTTGAGDAFCGAFAHALLGGRAPVDAARFACRAASLSVTRAGTAKAMPSRADMEAADGGP